jgi:hypothetical protein
MALQECKQYGVFGDAADIVGQVPEPHVSGYRTYGGSAYGNDTYPPNSEPLLSMSMQDSMPFRGDAWLLFWRMSKESKLE